MLDFCSRQAICLCVGSDSLGRSVVAWVCVAWALRMSIARVLVGHALSHCVVGGQVWQVRGRVAMRLCTALWLSLPVAWPAVLNLLELGIEVGLEVGWVDVWRGELSLSNLLHVVGLLEGLWVSPVSRWALIAVRLGVVVNWVVDVGWLAAIDVTIAAIITSCARLVVSWLDFAWLSDLIFEELVSWGLVWDVWRVVDLSLSDLVVLWHHLLVFESLSLVLWVPEWGLIANLDNASSWWGSQLLLLLQEVWGAGLVVITLWLVLVRSVRSITSVAVRWSLLEDSIVVVDTGRSSPTGSISIGLVWLTFAAVDNLIWSDKLVDVEWLLVSGWLVKWVLRAPFDRSVLWRASIILVWVKYVSWMNLWNVWVLWATEAGSAVMAAFTTWAAGVSIA